MLRELKPKEEVRGFIVVNIGGKRLTKRFVE